MVRSIVASMFVAILMMVAGCNEQSTGDIEVAKAMRLYEVRKFQEAIPHLEIALNEPLRGFTRSDVLTTIGVCYYEIDELAKALEYHSRAIEENPNNHQAYVNQGVVYRLMEEFDKAEAAYTKALEIAPNYAELHVSLGALALHQQEHEAAIKHLKRGIELDDSLPVAHSNLALVYATLGRFDEAEHELTKAKERGYHQPEAIQVQIDRLRARFEQLETQ